MVDAHPASISQCRSRQRQSALLLLLLVLVVYTKDVWAKLQPSGAHYKRNPRPGPGCSHWHLGAVLCMNLSPNGCLRRSVQSGNAGVLCNRDAAQLWHELGHSQSFYDQDLDWCAGVRYDCLQDYLPLGYVASTRERPQAGASMCCSTGESHA
jgi:hypothetical protein